MVWPVDPSALFLILAIISVLIYSHFVIFILQGYDSLIKKDIPKYFAFLIAYYGYQGGEEGTETKLFCSVSMCFAKFHQYLKKKYLSGLCPQVLLGILCLVTIHKQSR